jgi:hypothetical protein
MCMGETSEEIPEPVHSDSRRAVRVVVRAVVAQTAPEELPLLDAVCDRCGDDAAALRMLARRRRRHDPLSFGLEAYIPLAAPIVWAVLDQMVRTGVDGAMPRFRAALRRLRPRRRPDDTPSVPELTPEQVAVVREKIRSRAEAAGMETERAQALADRVAVELLLPRSPDTE